MIYEILFLTGIFALGVAIGIGGGLWIALTQPTEEEIYEKRIERIIG